MAGQAGGIKWNRPPLITPNMMLPNPGTQGIPGLSRCQLNANAAPCWQSSTHASHRYIPMSYMPGRNLHPHLVTMRPCYFGAGKFGFSQLHLGVWAFLFSVSCHLFGVCNILWLSCSCMQSSSSPYIGKSSVHIINCMVTDCRIIE